MAVFMFVFASSRLAASLSFVPSAARVFDDAIITVVLSIGVVALDLTAADKDAERVILSGRTFRAIAVAAKEAEGHGLKIEDYEIRAKMSADSIWVGFGDPNYNPERTGLSI